MVLHDQFARAPRESPAEVRREARASGVGFRLAEESVRHFTLPDSSLKFASELPLPIYPPPRDTREASN